LIGLRQSNPESGPCTRSNDTVASHITTALGRQPEQGERVTVEGVDVEIEVIEGGNIASVIVGTADPLPEQDA